MTFFPYNGLLKLAGLCLVSFACFGLSAQGQTRFSLEEKEGRKVLIVFFDNSELDRSLSLGKLTSRDLLQIYRGRHIAPPTNLPAIVGRYQYAKGQIDFQPLVDFRPGAEFTAFFFQNNSYRFSIPEPRDQMQPRVVGVFPSSDTLPANQLKFYIEFSEPMGEGRAYENLSLVDEQGDTVRAPFVRLQPELWNQDQTRLTLWVDPGRVKRALGPNEAAGVPIKKGRRYSLYIQADWKSQEGQALGKVYQKNFYAGSADRQKLQSNKWRIQPPSPNTRSPLQIQFGESLDYALGLRSLTVWSDETERVEGRINLQDNERQWRFLPDYVWKPGKYQIRIAAKLEDLAGNNLNRLFDRDLSLEKEKPSTQEFYELEFWVR